MDDKLKSALVVRARYIIQERGIEGFLKWRAMLDACGCMGPQGDEPVCPCRMRDLLQEHKVTILNEIDPAAALSLLRSNIIKALKG